MPAFFKDISYNRRLCRKLSLYAYSPVRSSARPGRHLQDDSFLTLSTILASTYLVFAMAICLVVYTSSLYHFPSVPARCLWWFLRAVAFVCGASIMLRRLGHCLLTTRVALEATFQCSLVARLAAIQTCLIRNACMIPLLPLLFLFMFAGLLRLEGLLVAAVRSYFFFIVFCHCQSAFSKCFIDFR